MPLSRVSFSLSLLVRALTGMGYAQSRPFTVNALSCALSFPVCSAFLVNDSAGLLVSTADAVSSSHHLAAMMQPDAHVFISSPVYFWLALTLFSRASVVEILDALRESCRNRTSLPTCTVAHIPIPMTGNRSLYEKKMRNNPHRTEWEPFAPRRFFSAERS